MHTEVEFLSSSSERENGFHSMVLQIRQNKSQMLREVQSLARGHVQWHGKRIFRLGISLPYLGIHSNSSIQT